MSARLDAMNAALGPRHRQTGEVLADVPPGVPHHYLDQLPPTVEPSFRDQQRATILVDQISAQHDEQHRRHGHPFCGVCRGGYARNSLMRMLMLDTRFDPTVIDCGGRAAETVRSDYFTYDELGGLPEPEWLVYGVLPQGGIGYITGRDGTGKTFLAVDLMVSIVTWTSNQPWHGDRWVEVGGWGRALILEGEGVGSMRKRIDAALEARGLSLTEEQKRSIVVRNGTVDLHGGNGDFHGLLEFVEAFQPDIVIIDTLNRSAGGADQNSASDMSVITQRLHRIAQAAETRATAGERCTVAVVAHTDKGDNDARGSSAIEDDADFVLHCKKTEDRVKVKVAKMKDGESGLDITLQMKPFGQSIALVDGGDAAEASDAPRRRRIELCMKLRDEIDAHPGATTRALNQAVRGRAEDIAEALRWLIEREHVRVEPGARNASLHFPGPVRFVVAPTTALEGSA